MKKTTKNQNTVTFTSVVAFLTLIGLFTGMVGLAANSTMLVIYGLLPAIGCMFTGTVVNGLRQCRSNNG